MVGQLKKVVLDCVVNVVISVRQKKVVDIGFVILGWLMVKGVRIKATSYIPCAAWLVFAV